jgi:Fic/DOC family
MLFRVAEPDLEDEAVLDEIHGLRLELAGVLRVPRRWDGGLRRSMLARAIQASNSIEGYDVELDDAAAALDDEEPLSADEQTFAEIRGYRQALGFVLAMAGDPDFTVEVSAIRGMHFMMLGHDLSKSPGSYRQGAIYVRDETRDRNVYEGPPADDVPGLVEELVRDLASEPAPDPLIQAAMAHLNLVMIHPFRDGNGRMARALQTLVLSRGGIGEPAFSSIEEWLGSNTDDYYRVLAEVQRSRCTLVGPGRGDRRRRPAAPRRRRVVRRFARLQAAAVDLCQAVRDRAADRDARSLPDGRAGPVARSRPDQGSPLCGRSGPDRATPAGGRGPGSHQ